MTKYNQKLGNLGQKLAVKYLKKKNYQVISKNINFRQGEIDILAEKDNILRFIEVKTRSNLNFGDPIYSITRQKKKHLKNFIALYILKNRIQEDYRLEYIFILLDKKTKKAKIKHLDDIF
ncbi:YraN family protein [bacterium]|nr:YraN family protein [bacterium]